MQSPIDNVYHLNTTTFQPVIESMAIVLLAVVMLPVSRRSLNFVPEYRKIANLAQDLRITCAQINALDNGQVLAPFEINEFPHVMLFQGLENFRTYRGPFKEVEILSYLNRLLEFPILSTLSSTSLSKFKESSDVVVVAFIAAEDTDSVGKYKSLAERMHPEYVFGIVDDSLLAQSERINMPGIALYRSSIEEINTISFTDNTAEMALNLRKAARPLIVELAFETHSSLWNLGIPLGYIFADTVEERARLRKDIEPLARRYRKEIQFTIADPVELEDIQDDLHLDASHSPAFAIREPGANLRYPMHGSRGTFDEALKSFVQEYFDGKLQPVIKSEPVPVEPEDALYKAVGLNYQEIVMDETRDVLLVFCISSCGPCEAFQPTLEMLAELFAADTESKDKITIAKIMYDANDTPERAIRAFPTIKLFPAALKKAPVTFLGRRTLNELTDFIRNEGTYGVDPYASVKKQSSINDASKISTGQESCIHGKCVTTIQVDFENTLSKNRDQIIVSGINTPKHGEL